MTARARALVGLALGATCALACSGLVGPGSAFGRAGREAEPEGRPPYRPDRRDYIAFRTAHPDVLEPNYLPFMLHRVERDGPEGDLLLLCRWDDARMPLRVLVAPPRLPAALQDEFRPVAPGAFVEAAANALRIWERELEGLVRFERTRDPEQADLRVRLLGERAPAPRADVTVLGATEALHAACEPQGRDPDAERQRVRFELPELVIYLADEHGLLTPGQVERIALHELGHALGMLGHSPNPGDMMFAAYRERSEVETLSQSDVQSFVSLYRLPNGTHYGVVAPGGPPPPPLPFPPTGTPVLADAPSVDASRGLSLRFPFGWLVAETRRGVFAANGPVWDYDASIELAVWPYARTDAFLARYGDALLAGAWLRRRERTMLAGREGLRILAESPDGSDVRDLRFVELGDGRLLLVVAQCPAESERAWRPWIEASLASLELAVGGGPWRGAPAAGAAPAAPGGHR